MSITEFYNKFLKEVEVPSLFEFEEILENIPDFDYEKFNWNMCDFELGDDYSYYKEFITNGILCYSKSAFLDELYFKEKKISLWDIESLEELEYFNEIFSNKGWIIINYDDVKEQLLEQQLKNTKRSLSECFEDILRESDLKIDSDNYRYVAAKLYNKVKEYERNHNG